MGLQHWTDFVFMFGFRAILHFPYSYSIPLHLHPAWLRYLSSFLSSLIVLTLLSSSLKIPSCMVILHHRVDSIPHDFLPSLRFFLVRVLRFTFKNSHPASFRPFVMSFFSFSSLYLHCAEYNLQWSPVSHVEHYLIALFRFLGLILLRIGHIV